MREEGKEEEKGEVEEGEGVVEEEEMEKCCCWGLLGEGEREEIREGAEREERRGASMGVRSGVVVTRGEGEGEEVEARI